MAVNVPPESGVRVPAEEMSGLVTDLFEAAGTPREDAELMGSILVETDLRGIFSHGTKMTADYVGKMLDGEVNPRPEIQVVRNSGATGVIDGDGGLGHFPCHRATELAIKEAKVNGIASFTTRNHFHFGAAGTYARMALEHDCVGIAVSSRRIKLDPGESVARANSGPPFSIAVPANRQPPLVMDMGVTGPWEKTLVDRYRQVVLKDLALGTVLHALGGILAGVYRSEFTPPRSHWLSDQGAFIVVIDAAAFMPIEEFKNEMDRFIGEARKMRPLSGANGAELAGGLEWEREKDYSRNGIPISDEHRQSLQQIADRLGVQTPFSRFEETRFEPGAEDIRRSLVHAGTTILRRAGKRFTRILGT